MVVSDGGGAVMGGGLWVGVGVDEGEDVGAEFVEGGGADAGDGDEAGGVGGALFGDGHEGGVGEDDVGGDLQFAGAGAAPVAEAGEQLLVDVGRAVGATAQLGGHGADQLAAADAAGQLGAVGFRAGGAAWHARG